MSSYLYKSFGPQNKLTYLEKNNVSVFLQEQLEEYGDDIAAIKKCINYAMKDGGGQGGFVITCNDKETCIGAVVINETGMSDYIPENILVYIAIHKNYRGKGIGRELMQHAMNTASGSIALHVEPNNPAKFLYEKLGFQNKYLEMRLDRSNG